MTALWWGTLGRKMRLQTKPSQIFFQCALEIFGFSSQDVKNFSYKGFNRENVVCIQYVPFLEMFCFVRNSFFLGKWISKEIVQKGPEELEKEWQVQTKRSKPPPCPPQICQITQKSSWQGAELSQTQKVNFRVHRSVFFTKGAYRGT